MTAGRAPARCDRRHRALGRGSLPAILLRESYRQDGKVKNRTLANLSAWPDAKVDALARVLKGQPPAAALDGAPAGRHHWDAFPGCGSSETSNKGS